MAFGKKAQRIKELEQALPHAVTAKAIHDEIDALVTAQPGAPTEDVFSKVYNTLDQAHRLQAALRLAQTLSSADRLALLVQHYPDAELAVALKAARTAELIRHAARYDTAALRAQTMERGHLPFDVIPAGNKVDVYLCWQNTPSSNRYNHDSYYTQEYQHRVIKTESQGDGLYYVLGDTSYGANEAPASQQADHTVVRFGSRAGVGDNAYFEPLAIVDTTLSILRVADDELFTPGRHLMQVTINNEPLVTRGMYGMPNFRPIVD